MEDVEAAGSADLYASTFLTATVFMRGSCGGRRGDGRSAPAGEKDFLDQVQDPTVKNNNSTFHLSQS